MNRHCRHTTTYIQNGKNGGLYRVCDRCTAVTKIIRVGPEQCGEPLPDFGGTCTFPKGHDASSDPLEQLHGFAGGKQSVTS